MGVAALICGRKGLSAVEPEQTKGVAKLSPCSKEDSSYYGGNYEPAAGAKPRNTGLTAGLTTWTASEEERGGSVEVVAGRGPREAITLQASNSSSNSPSGPAIRVSEEVANKFWSKGLLGRGKYSHVLQVEDRRSREQFALKIVQKLPPLELEGNSYKVEVDILKRCSHPSIVSLHQVIHSVDKVYLVLELASGGDLFDCLATQGAFSEQRAKRVLRMVLEGVAYLHDNRITHRDLKLENLLFKSQREDSPILITDFGLAHVATGGHGDQLACNGNCMSTACDYMSTTCGTAEYMSPEMLEGEDYTNKVDMWAVGVVTYTLLSGSMPFEEGAERGGRARMYRDIKMGTYSTSQEVWHAVSNSALSFIGQLLQVDQHSRLSATQALAHPWHITSPPALPKTHSQSASRDSV